MAIHRCCQKTYNRSYPVSSVTDSIEFRIMDRQHRKTMPLTAWFINMPARFLQVCNRVTRDRELRRKVRIYAMLLL